jgi:NAD(P)-dependent dehydrogenase (short-subunit alcohol dehydrogenase family)
VSILKNKVAVVTGGGSGIGRAIATRFAAAGATVTILEQSETSGAEALAEIEAAGGQVRVVACNVTSLEGVQEAFQALPRLDILVNNAGIAHVGTVEQTSPADLDRIYSVNVKGVYHCLHVGVPKMVSGGGGAILNLASIASKIGIRDRFAYSMSKGAVLSMTLSVARDYIDKGIRSNCVCPARVHTPFVDGFIEKNYPDRKEEMFRQLSEYQPIGRMGRPDEIAALALFLCSDEAAFITGAAYDIDGGVISLR